MRKYLRKNHKVRPLTDLEEHLNFDRLPDGVYAFISPISYSDDYAESLKSREAYKNIHYPTGAARQLEIHKLKDSSFFMIGYISNETAFKMQTSTDEIKILFFTDLWAEALRLVAIPFDRIIVGEVREFREIYVIDLKLEPMK
ncbi:MAG: hypothetical protein IIB40_12010 [Candidatus Marinimicrobia bacterium]|nr:hypothetical protein [Candidatus Neomarinimicrobiota bacterium]